MNQLQKWQRNLNLSVLSMLLIVLSPYALTQTDILNRDPLSIESVNTAKGTLEVGENLTVSLEVFLANQHHAYTQQLKIHHKNLNWLSISQPSVPKEVEFKDPVSDTVKKGLGPGSSQIQFVIEPKKSAPLGPQVLNMELEYQACTAKYCLLPIRKFFTFQLEIADPNVIPKRPTASIEQLGSSEGVQALITSHFLLAIGLIFFAGVLTSLTPCIFPMIPITLAVLGTGKAEVSKLGGFLLSLSYVFGLALTYASLGVAAALTGSLFGSFLGHPLVAVGLGIGFGILGLSMFGAFELKVPDFLVRRLPQQSGHGPLPAFLGGLAAGLLASPCVGPVLVGLLAFIAQTKDAKMGFGLMFVFALGMGQLFLILGTFSQATKKLPRSGPWMDFVKFIMGSTMIGLGLFYVQPILTETVFHVILGIVLITLTSYFGAFNQELERLGQLKKGVFLALFFVGVLFVGQALFPKFFERSSDSEMTSAQKRAQEEPLWEEFSFEKLEAARASSKGVIVDFYADWCLACKEMEVDSFPHSEVQALKEKFVWLQFDATQITDDFNRLKDEHGILGLPWILFYGPNGEKRDQLTLTGYEDGPDFAKRMRKTLQSPQK